MRRHTVVATLLVSVVAGGAGAVGLAYAGVVDVSARGPEPAPLRWFLGTVREHSIARRAEPIEVPPLGAPTQLDEGLRHYQAMCAGCHGGPGLDRDEVGAGLQPPPPHLGEAHEPLAPAQVFWVVQNGIRMTGMPAFGSTHDDATIWSIVALVEALPDMTVADYRARLEALEEHTPHATHGEHSHDRDEAAEAAEAHHPHGDHDHHH